MTKPTNDVSLINWYIGFSNGNFCAFVSFCDINKTDDITFEDIKNETAQSFALNGSFSNSIDAPKKALYHN